MDKHRTPAGLPRPPAPRTSGPVRPLLPALLCAWAGLTAAPAATLHVDRDATGANNGSGWTNAFVSLQDALAAAGGGDEIWVAAGVYYPDEAAGADTGSRTTPFRLVDGVDVYGGFAGTETNRDARAPLIHVTILSGDVDENDVNADGNFIAETITAVQDENAYTVVMATGLTAGVVLSGFTITAAKADAAAPSGGPEQNGGGVFVANSRLTLTDCTLVGNYVVDDGAGLGQPDFTDTSNLSLLRCRFLNNVAKSAGGGMEMESGAYLALQETEFRGNRAIDVGAGALRAEPAEFFARNALFTGNTCGTLAGALALAAGTSRLVHCTFSANRAQGGLGGAMDLRADTTLDNCIINNNRDVTGTNALTASVSRQGGVIVFRHCVLANAGGSGPGWNTNAGTDGGGNLDLDPRFLAPAEPLASPQTNGDFRLGMTSPANNAGDNSLVVAAVDLAGLPRIFGGVVDPGAFETVDNLADGDADGLTDWQETALYRSNPSAADTDGDAAGDYDEAVAGTVPTNAGSYFRLGAIAEATNRLLLRWDSATGRVYSLAGLTNLFQSGWLPVSTNIPASPPMNVFTVAPPFAPAFSYRLGVKYTPP